MAIPEPGLDDLYREVVLDHYRNPRGREPITEPDAANEGFNPVCGDEVKVSIRLDGLRLEGIEVQGRGCSISVASGSILAERLRGMTVAEVRTIFEAFRARMHGEAPVPGVDLGDLEALEGVRRFPVRIKCALLPWVTLRDALDAVSAGRKSPKRSSTTESGEEKEPLPRNVEEVDRPDLPCEVEEEPPGESGGESR